MRDVTKRDFAGIVSLELPNEELELRFDVKVEDLPIDGHFRDALDEQGRKVVESLDITGLTTAEIECYRAPGLDLPTDIFIKAEVKDAKMEFCNFRYDIERLSGRIEFQSKEKQLPLIGRTKS